MASTGLPPRPADSKKTKWVFNPPPGWPVPPTDWKPQHDWQPDSSWPPAPDDWKFWKPAQEAGRRKASTLIKATVTALTLAATIIGTYLAYLALHENRITTGSWVRQANAACDQDIGPLDQSLFNGLAPSAAGQGDSSTQSSRVTEVSAMIGAVGSMSKLIGDLTALQTPQDSHAPQTQVVLSTGNALVDNLETFSNAAEDALENTPGTTISQDLATEASASRQYPAKLLAWQQAIEPLGLNRCPFWSSNPKLIKPLPQQTSPAASQPGQPISLTGGEQQLVDLLNSNDLINCTGRPDLESTSIVAAVNCQAVNIGPTKRPLVVQFANFDSAQAWFDNNTVGFVDDDNCAGGYKLGTWTHDDVVSGMLGCAYTGDGDFRTVWIFNNALIGVIADGSNGPAMNIWWTESAYLINSQG
jgi:hypothetical protein